MYSMDDDLLLIQRLNETASTGMGLPEMRSASNVDQLLQTKPLFRSNPSAPQVYSAGMPGLTSMPDGPSGQVAGYASRATRGMPSNLNQFSRAIDPQGIMTGTAKDTSWLAKRVGVNPATATKVGRFAGRAVPVLSAIANVQDAANIVTGEESFGNKVMDTAFGTAGAIGGFVFGGGPLGASVGFSAGKALSDGTQWMFGDKKTPEQRKMELAMQQLQGGRMV